MRTHVRKDQNESMSSENNSSRRQGNASSTFQFTDHRPEAIQLQRLQGLAASGPRVQQLKTIQDLADGSLQARQAVPLWMSSHQVRGMQPLQRTIDDDLQALKNECQSTNDPLLRKVLQESLLLSDVKYTSDSDPESGHAERQQQGNTLAHLINLDPKIADPETRESLILHELIHVSADRKYNVNQTGEPEPALTAVVDTNASEQDRIESIGQQAKYRAGLATHLINVVDGDWVVDEKVANLVIERARRIQGASHREFDSVVTELFYRLKKMGADERTDTFKEVAAMTAAAYRSRHEQLPLHLTYKEPMKTGFLN